ncbi:MAG: hypothetical protein KGY39_02855 [Anaerolineales bacterium]|nr:hypothetical protein [Anaerolineales bacterium]MBS3752534.1 hypothetical protein [Anaerolineales bacterium]
MSLFFVQHTHDAATCPAKDPKKGNMLLNHLQPQNARKFGVKLHADAVINGKHTFNLILEADDEENVSEFMRPFETAGSVNILPASHCEKVVQQEGC